MTRIIFPIRDASIENQVIQHFSEYTHDDIVVLTDFPPAMDEYYTLARRVVPYAREAGPLHLVINQRWDCNTFIALVIAKIMARRAGNRHKFDIVEVMDSGYIRTLQIP